MLKKNISREIEIAAGQNIQEYEYWMAKLSGQLVKSGFPFDHKASAPDRMEGGEGVRVKPFRFEDETASKLIKLSKGSDYTLHVALAAVLTALLYRYTNNQDIIIGTPIYRQEPEGEYINTLLALRNHLQESMTFKELLMQVKQTVLEAVEHQAYPVELLPEKLNIPFPGSGDDFPLFDVVLLLLNIHQEKYLRDRNIKPNIVFFFFNEEGRVEAEVEYNGTRYREDTIDRIINHFNRLVSRALDDIEQQLDCIDILSEKEKKQLLVDFNNTDAAYPHDKTIQQLFKEQARRTPDGIAIHMTYKTYRTYMTYDQLNEKSNQLAVLLIEKGVKPDTIVGIMLERSIEMIVGVLGIMVDF